MSKIISWAINYHPMEFYEMRETYKKETGGREGWAIDLVIAKKLVEKHIMTNSHLSYDDILDLCRDKETFIIIL